MAVVALLSWDVPGAQAGGCRGTQGNPLILGCDNTAAGTTSLSATTAQNAPGLSVKDPGYFSIGTYVEDTGTGGIGMSAYGKSAGVDHATVSGVSLTSNSLILATVESTAGGAFVKQAVPNVAAGSFTVHLDGSHVVDVPVAWFVVN